MATPSSSLPPLPKGASFVDAQGLPPLPPGARFADTSTAAPQPRPPSTLTSVINSIPQVGMMEGALKGVGTLVGALDNTSWGKRINSAILGPQEAERERNAYDALVTPTNTPQRIGYGAEKVGEFFLPEAGEIGKIGEVGNDASNAEKLIGLAKQVLTQGAAQGAIAKEQGANPYVGAVIGGVGPIVGAGLRAVAPSLAEAAIGIRRADRAYGAEPGEALLNMTHGFSPGKVAESARGAISPLTERLEQIADEASLPTVSRIQPNTRLALPPGPQEMEAIPLHEASAVVERPSGLQPAARETSYQTSLYPYRPAFRSAPAIESVGAATARNAPEGEAVNFLDRLAQEGAGGVTHPEINAASAPDVTHPLEHPLRTTAIVEPAQGVVLRPKQVGAVPDIPATPESVGLQVNRRTVALQEARDHLAGLLQKATSQNKPETIRAIQQVMKQLNEWADSGEEIPNEVSPREALNLKRGLQETGNYVSEPGVDRSAKSKAAKQAAHVLNRGLSAELGPEYDEVNSKLHDLIPVAKRAQSADNGAQLPQRLIHRIAAHTGSLAGGVGGGLIGYNRDGLAGAATGALAGTAVPEIIGAPTSTIALSRLLYSPVARKIGTAALQGAAARIDH